jgi:hypothetical protein
LNILTLFDGRKSEGIAVSCLYIAISVFFLFGLLESSGDVAQSDWGMPISPSAAIKDFSSRMFVHNYNGFGDSGLGRFGFPFFQLINAVLAPAGFVGGLEIKILSVFLVALAGVASYILARSFHLSKLSSFLCGLFFMSSAVAFDWLMIGWIYYLIGYALFPVMILFSKKYVETNQISFALINGLILAVVASQPGFLLVYPTVGFLFVLFQSKTLLSGIKKGLALISISMSVWFLSALSFFSSYLNAETFSFYQSDYFNAILHQYANLSNAFNAMRLWGATYNFQFETYYPQSVIIFSAIPIVLAAVMFLLNSKNKMVVFFFLSFMFTFLAYFVSSNLRFIVFNLPFGSIFEAPSIFLVPAGMGLAMLIGYSNEILPLLASRFRKGFSGRFSKKFFSALIFILIVLAGLPWWAGQASGNAIQAPATKLNLYQVPSGFTEWNGAVNADNRYFVFYVTLDTNVQIENTSFSEPYEGVNMGIFTEINDLPYVSVSNSSLLLDDLMNNSSSAIACEWGSFSIKYVVVYTNVVSRYNMSDILDRLEVQDDLVKTANLPSVVVFENQNAKQVVYSDDAVLNVIYNDPTSFKVEASSNASFTLIFNQAFSSYWRATLNGSVLSETAHFKSANGFNGWQIDSVGNMTIDLYYEQQTIYMVSMTISVVTIVAILSFLFFSSVRKRKSNPEIKKQK